MYRTIHQPLIRNLNTKIGQIVTDCTPRVKIRQHTCTAGLFRHGLTLSQARRSTTTRESPMAMAPRKRQRSPFVSDVCRTCSGRCSLSIHLGTMQVVFTGTRRETPLRRRRRVAIDRPPTARCARSRLCECWCVPPTTPALPALRTVPMTIRANHLSWPVRRS
jgi:hypothetical protein